MSLNKLFIIFGLILAIFAGIVFYQFNSNKVTDLKAPKNTVRINKQTFSVEVVNTPEKWQLGLSGRESLPKNQGMLFAFDKKAYHTFWMKDMKFSIDIIFINDDKIVSIEKNAKAPTKGQENLPLYKSAGPINRVLEINAGLSDKHKIKPGDKVEIKLSK
ncbi:MAG TPA: DUF192 domain-containing protein [Candidatus Limnocylindrales bacterium]|nr:DUF192 domain-containing protein [Candidatus Limnocylindrales bacterium]